MRLIDADALIRHLNDYALTESPSDNESAGERRISENVVSVILNCIEAVAEQPTAYDAEAVVAELENASYRTESTFDEDGYCNDDSEEVIELQKAISIVRGKE